LKISKFSEFFGRFWILVLLRKGLRSLKMRYSDLIRAAGPAVAGWRGYGPALSNTAAYIAR
jgi:hypothetical protein